MVRSFRFWPTRYPILSFFVLTYGITWGLSTLSMTGWLPFQLPSLVRSLSAMLLHYGPALAGLTMSWVVDGGRGVRNLLNRLCIWRVGSQWYLFVLLYPLAARWLVVSIDWMVNRTPPRLFEAGGVPVGNPLLLIVPIFAAIFFQAGLAEEIGWRGYALPHLQMRYGALTASLMVGLPWAFWHFHPRQWSMMLPHLPWYVLAVLAFSVMLTWVFNHTQGSLLLAVLYHTASNTADWIIPVSPTLSAAGSADLFHWLVRINVGMCQ